MATLFSRALGRVRGIASTLTPQTIQQVSPQSVDAGQPAMNVTDAIPANPNALGDAGFTRIGGTSPYMNFVSGLGTPSDASYFDTWVRPRALTDDQRRYMGRNALIRNAVLALFPNEATREGWTVKITDEDVDDPVGISAAIMQYEQRKNLAIADRCAEAMIRALQYGDAIVILGIEDGQSFDQPVNVENIRSIWWARVIDRRDFNYGDIAGPESKHFGEPLWYDVTDLESVLPDGIRYGDQGNYSTGANFPVGTQYDRRFHHSRVLRFTAPNATSQLDAIQDALGSFFAGTGGITQAAREHSVGKWSIKDWFDTSLSGWMERAREFVRRANSSKSSVNAIIVDQGKEDFEYLNRSVSGLAELINPIMVWISAASRTPVTVQWGVSPGGFGTGESERDTFHEAVRAMQTRQLEPELHKFHDLVLRAKDGPSPNYWIPSSKRELVFADLNPTDEVEAQELASKQVDDLVKLVEKGIITPDEAAASLPQTTDFTVQLDYEQREARRAAGEVVEVDPMQVGIFTGMLETLLPLYALGVVSPVQARAFMRVADPSRFQQSPGLLLETFPDRDETQPALSPAAQQTVLEMAPPKFRNVIAQAQAQSVPAPATAAATTETTPSIASELAQSGAAEATQTDEPTGTVEADPELAEEEDDGDYVYASIADMPNDTLSASAIAKHLTERFVAPGGKRIPTGRIKKLAKEGRIQSWDLLGGEPVHSLGEVYRELGLRNTAAPVEPTTALVVDAAEYTIAEVIDPYSNEHAARQREPSTFVEGSFRRKSIAAGVDLILGRLRGGDGSMQVQAVRFDRERFTPAQARRWLAEHDYKTTLEPATEVRDDGESEESTETETETSETKVEIETEINGVEVEVEIEVEAPAPEPAEDVVTNVEHLGVYIRVPEPLARWVPYKAQDPSPPHITMLYIGTATPEQAAALNETVRLQASTLPPVAIELTGEVGYFDNDRGDGSTQRVAYAKVEIDAAQELHDLLRAAASMHGIEVKHANYNESFTPHVTLAYLAAGEEYDGPVPSGKWIADSLEVWHDETQVELLVLAQADKSEAGTAGGFFESGSDPKIYTKPELRNRLRTKILREGRGGSPGEWSARKAQLLALEYKREGGGYRDSEWDSEDYVDACLWIESMLDGCGMEDADYTDKAEQQRALQQWTEEEWMTCLPSGPSNEPAGSKRRYLPKRACEKLSPSQRAATARAKAAANRKGEQFAANTEAAREARSEATIGDVLGQRFAESTGLYTDEEMLAWEDGWLWLADAAKLSDEQRKRRIDEAFKKFHATVNMSASELEDWSKTRWSTMASLSREPIERNLRLLRKPKDQWTLADATGAMRTVSFVSRMRKGEQGEPLKDGNLEGPSKRDVSLLNWAFDPRK